MADTLRVACVQLCAGADKAANLVTAERLVGHAAEEGAELVVLPEKWNGVAASSAGLAALAEPLEAGESVDAMASWARKHGLTIVGGPASSS
jgi:predicted amidohydrolase